MSFLRSTPDADLKAVLRLDPALGTPFAHYHEALLRGPSPFTEGERELIGAYVSALNGCDFCHTEHEAVAEAFGVEAGLVDALLKDLETAPLTPKLRAVLRYVAKLNATPGRMVQADADAVFAEGWDDVALYHAASICALFNMNNRIVDGLGIPAHGTAKLAETAARLHRDGYASTAAFVSGEWSE